MPFGISKYTSTCSRFFRIRRYSRCRSVFTMSVPPSRLVVLEHELEANLGESGFVHDGLGAGPTRPDDSHFPFSGEKDRSGVHLLLTGRAVDDVLVEHVSPLSQPLLHFVEVVEHRNLEAFARPADFSVRPQRVSGDAEEGVARRQECA